MRLSWRSTRRWLRATLVVSALALGVLLWFTSGDVPRADEWDTPGAYLLAHANGSATFGQLFQQHNESRVVFAQLLAGFIADHWGWNQHVFHALNWLLLVATALLFVGVVARTWPAEERGSHSAVMVLCLAVGLIFIPTQWRNLLASGQIVTIAIPCLLLAGLSVNLATHLPAWQRYACAGACALVACFSYINGLMLWFLLWPAPLVLLRHGRARFRASELPATLVYFAVALATIAAYLASYHRPPGHPSLATGLGIPLRSLLFAASLLCGPILPERVDHWFLEGRPLPLLLCGGLAGICCLLAAVYLIRSWRRFASREFLLRAFPFLVLVAYSAAAALPIGFARSPLGRLGNLSRYSTIAIPAWLGLAGLVAALERSGRPADERRILRPLALVLALAFAASAWIGGIECLLDKADSRQAKLSLAFRRICPEDPLLGNVFPRRGDLLAKADGLERIGALPPLPSYAWIDQAVPAWRGDLTYRLRGGEVRGLRSIQGMLLPAARLEADDVLLLWNRETERPTTAFLAPVGASYPGRDAGSFEIRFAAAGQAGVDLAKHELRLARPRTQEVWRLSPQ
jgi:hypothetical protein